MHTLSRSTPAASAAWLDKVPDVALSFWVVKIMSTTVGETGADFLAVNAGLGQDLHARRDGRAAGRCAVPAATGAALYPLDLLADRGTGRLRLHADHPVSYTHLTLPTT